MCMSCFLGLENGHFDVTHSPQSTSNTLETIPESFPENLRIYSQPMPDKSFQGTQFFANICNLTSPTQNQTKNIQLIVKEQTQVYKWWLHKLLSKVRGFLWSLHVYFFGVLQFAVIPCQIFISLPLLPCHVVYKKQI